MGLKSAGLLFVVFIVVLCGSMQLASAQNFLNQYDKPLSDMKLLPAEEFNAKTRLYEESAKAESSLAYEIRIPKDWTAPMEGQSDGSLDGGFLGIVGRFYGPPSTIRSRIEIRSYKLDYQMTVKEWMVQYLSSNGYSFQGMNVYNNDAAEAAYVMLDRSDTYVIRSVAVINGKNLILIEYFLPMDRWEEEKIQQAQVIKSFKLRNIVEEFAEKLTSYQFLDIATMQYPESWQLKAMPIRSVEFMTVQLLKYAITQDEKNSKLDGQMDVELISVYASDTLDAEIERYKEALKKQGLIVSDLIEEPEIVTNPLFDFADTKVYKLVSPGDTKERLIEYELWQSIVSAQGYYYYITLLTPARGVDYFLWSRNKNTYQMLLNLFRPQSDEYDAQTVPPDVSGAQNDDLFGQ